MDYLGSPYLGPTAVSDPESLDKKNNSKGPTRCPSDVQPLSAMKDTPKTK